MTIPSVTIIMTVYNGSKFIEEALESIRDQTFKDFEFLLYDDGSTDNTPSIIDNFFSKHKIGLRPRSWVQGDENFGVAAGRISAISLAYSKYIAIADADDVNLPERIEKQVGFLESHPDIFCCGSGILKIDAKGDPLSLHVQPEDHTDIVNKMLRGINPMYDPTAIFRFDDFIRIGGYTIDRNLLYVPDWELWCRAVLQKLKFHNLQEWLVKYRVHPDSNCRKHFKDILSQHDRVFTEFGKNY